MRSMRPIADILADAEEKRRKREQMRRWGPWVRTHASLLDDARLRLVSRRSGAPLPTIEAFLIRLELFAGASRQRGSLEGFNIAALAAHWSVANEDLLQRVYAELEHPDIGHIEQEFLVTFCERNPETADPNAAERMRRMRARKKQTTVPPQAAAVTRNSRNVTTRSDHNSIGRAVDNSGSRASAEAEGSFEQPFGTAPEQWLDTEGARIVSERAPMHGSRAATEIARWMRDADAELVAEILRETDTMGLTGGKFMDRVRCELSRRRSRQAVLPLPPRIARSGEANS